MSNVDYSEVYAKHLYRVVRTTIRDVDNNRVFVISFSTLAEAKNEVTKWIKECGEQDGGYDIEYTHCCINSSGIPKMWAVK